MTTQVLISSQRELHFEEFLEQLGMDDIIVAITPEDVPDAWGFFRKELSSTMFTIERTDDSYILSIDHLASYEDYRFFPYLLDTLNVCITDKPYIEDGKNAFHVYDDEWMADTMGEEIAYLKCTLKLGLKYYITLPLLQAYQYVDESSLNMMGVSLYSSTPRIFGYIVYMLRHNLLPVDEELDETMFTDDEVMVDVPQHVSIGTVLSWQTDGSETTESYAQEDVDLLLKIANSYDRNKPCEGVILNDIATIFEYGIGVDINPESAIFWYKEAITHGDNLYAPTSLGDIYRRGLGSIKPNLQLALEAYQLSTDPYSWYRIGQSYEEGWITEPDFSKAMEYYHKAASVGHHLALRRLECEDE